MGKKRASFFEELIDNSQEGRENGILREFMDVGKDGQPVKKLECKGCGEAARDLRGSSPTAPSRGRCKGSLA